MADKSLLKRGFKTQAERLAISYRCDLSLSATQPLEANDLAKHLGIAVFPATEFLSEEKYIKLLVGDEEKTSGWSALTMETKRGNKIIIHNPFHSVGRQQSNLMHELAHIICKHEFPTYTYDFAIPVGMRHFNPLQEEEAQCLGETLQLPRTALEWAIKAEMSVQEIANYFLASEEMVNYRLNISGVRRQQAFYKRRYAK